MNRRYRIGRRNQLAKVGLQVGYAALLACASRVGAADTVPIVPVDPQETPQSLLILRPDGSLGEPITEGHDLVRASLVVVPNVVGIARDSRQVQVPAFEGNAARTFDRITFEPRTGFTLTEDGDIIVDDDPAQVSYFWYGQLGSEHLFLTVRFGQVRAMLYGPTIRYGLSTEGGRTLLRDVDPAGADQSGCATNAIAALAMQAELPAVGSLSKGKVPPVDPSESRSVAPAPAGTGTKTPKHFARVGVLFYYTGAAEGFPSDPSNPSSPQLGTVGLQNIATGWIDQMNTTLRNSGDTYYVTFEQVGLVTPLSGYSELSQTQQPDPNQRFSAYLSFLRQYEQFTGAPTRASEGADLAVLMVADSGNPGATRVWGAAYTQRNNCLFDGQCEVGDGAFPIPSQFSFRNYGYGALTVSPDAANLTFSHELGHMLGSNHDLNVEYPLAGPGAPLGLRAAYAYSFGYRVSTVVRDVMADPPCIDDDGPGPGTTRTCTNNRQPQFGNPRVPFIGTATPSGTLSSDPTRTITCLAEPSGNLYPLGSTATSPNVFWSGFEAPGLPTSTCGTRVLW